MFFRALVIGCLIFANTAFAEIKNVPSSRSDMQLSFAPLVKNAAPAVVNIFTSKTVRTRSISPLFNDPFFRRFFGNAFPTQKKRKVQNSLGSGVIVGSDGIVVTNHHVIEGADDIKVVLNDRREFEATLLGSDERTDLAILKVETKGVKLPVLAFGNSDDLEVGDLVLAIGNPFGVGQTVTSGIVSALARTQVGITDYSFFIQTDAAINPGNSGGALVDMNGNLIGVNSAIYSKGGGSNGIGFAIPANMVRSVLSGVSEGGRLVRPWLGASGEVVTSDIADSLNMARPTGVLINEVYPKGPADMAGLKRGDVILTMDGYEINDPQALRFRLATLELAQTSMFDILRRGKEIKLVFEALPAPETPKRHETVLKGRNPFEGAVVVNMSPALNDELGWDMMTSGLAISKIRRGSTANRLRFKPGDRILGVNGLVTKSVKDLERVLKTIEGRQGDWAVDIMRNGKKIELAFRG